MERSWSDAARAAFDAYPWRSDGEKRKARAEAEMVSFGAEVEVVDLPLAVRRFARKGAPQQRFVWKGEAWSDISAEFERAVFGQALAQANGSIAAAARLLKTTPRIVAYAVKKHDLAAHKNLNNKIKKMKQKE